MSKKINYNEIFNSVILNKFINCFQRDGKKSFIEKILYETLLCMKKKKCNGILILFYCIELTKPLMVLLPSVKSGITYYVGSMLSFQEQYFTAIRWLIVSINMQKKKNYRRENYWRNYG